MGRRSICNDLIGTTYESKYWFSLDPSGLMCLPISVFVHLYSLVVIGIYLISNSTFSFMFYVLVYIPTAFMALWSLFMATTTNPGAVPKGARPLTTVRRATTATLNGNSGNSNSGSGNGLDEIEGGNGGEGGGDVISTAAGGEQQSQSQRGMKRCYKCGENFKPPRAHHDSMTGRCIVKFDHFCPWVNNAIGALNHKFFVLFLFYTCATCIQTLFLLIMRAVHCTSSIINPEDSVTEIEYNNDIDGEENNGGDNNEGQEVGNEDNGGGGRYLASSSSLSSSSAVGSAVYVNEDDHCDSMYHSHAILLLFIASVLFLIFTCAMGYEQIEAIQTNQGKIARMKQRVGDAGTEFQRVTTEFNEMFGGKTNQIEWHWFIPIEIQFHPKSMKKVVLGYDYDEVVVNPQQCQPIPSIEQPPPNESNILDEYHREDSDVVVNGDETKTSTKDQQDVEMGGGVAVLQGSAEECTTQEEIIGQKDPRNLSPSSSSGALSKRRNSGKSSISNSNNGSNPKNTTTTRTTNAVIT